MKIVTKTHVTTKVATACFSCFSVCHGMEYREPQQNREISIQIHDRHGGRYHSRGVPL